MEPLDLKKTTPVLVFVSFLTVFFVAVFFVAVFFVSVRMLAFSPKEIEVPKEIKPFLPDPFQDISLEAQAVYVFDARTGKTLFAQNEQAQLPLASLTKVMTALVASEMPSDTVIAYDHNERWKLKELLDYTLMVSSNNGASAIAGAGGALLHTERNDIASNGGSNDTEVFVQKMNEESHALGLSQTFYINPSGLDTDETLSGAYGSARDMALLFVHILEEKSALLEATSYASLRFTSLDGVSHSAENTNADVRTIPGILASKTGFTDLAGGNLVIAFDAGPAHPIIIAVLGSTQEGRFADVAKLIPASLRAVAGR